MSGGITRIAPESIISEMGNWALEAGSSYNDGWTRQHYQDQLNKVFEHIDKMRMSDDERQIQEEKKHWICVECGKSTFETDYDYLINPNLHLGCALEQEASEREDREGVYTK
jgi:hypothetical protein